MFLLTSCGGSGGTSATGGNPRNILAKPLHMDRSMRLFSSSKCLEGTLNVSDASSANGQIKSTLVLKNDCNDDVDLSQNTAVFVSQDTQGKPVAISSSFQVPSGIMLTFTSGSDNRQIGHFSFADPTTKGKPMLSAKQSLTFLGEFTLDNMHFDINEANNTLEIISNDPPVDYGSINVVVDTKDLDCKKITCSDINVKVNTKNGSLVQSFTIPSSQIGGKYTQLLNDIPVAADDQISATVINNTKITYDPSDAKVNVTKDTTQEVKVSYAPNIDPSGNVKITLNECLKDYTKPLHVKISSNDNATTYPIDISQGETKTLEGLSAGKYTVQLMQGIANPVLENNGYCKLSKSLDLLITKDLTTPLTINMTHPDGIVPVDLSVSGLVGNDNGIVTIKDSTNDYDYVNPTIQGNKQYRYQLLGLMTGLTVQVDSDKYQTNPIVIQPQKMISGLNLTAKFEPKVTPPTPSGKKVLSIFWCGFSGSYCGQSDGDDVNPRATHVIMAFANSTPNGSVVIDPVDILQPSGINVGTLINGWQYSGKKVLISVGGQNGNWSAIFQDATHQQNFIDSVINIIDSYHLDGVDLDIEAYLTPPETVAQVINNLRTALDGKFGSSPRKLIIVSPEDLTVSQTQNYTAISGAYNYFVPIIRDGIDAIDYVQPQFYNDWYDGFAGGTQNYVLDVYLNWRNHVGIPSTYNPNPAPIPSSIYPGVPEDKLIIGVIASTSAGGSSYYTPPDVLSNSIKLLSSQYNYDVGGVMLWDSHWDTSNGGVISNAAADALGIPK